MNVRPFHEVVGDGTVAKIVSLDQLLKRQSATAPAWMAPAPAPSPPPAPAAEPPPEPAVDPLADLEDRLNEAHAQGFVEGEKKALVAMEAVKAQLAGAIEGLVSAREQVSRPFLRDSVALAVIIARSLMNKVSDPESVLASVDEAIASLGTDEPLRIRLGNKTAEAVLAHRPELAKSHIELIKDPALEGKGCIAENAKRVVDATLETQLENIAASLIEQLEER